MRVKICGIKTVEHGLAAIEAGADLLGFVFAPSSRLLIPEEARFIVSGLRRATRGRLPKLVGVFVNEPLNLLEAIANYCSLDYVQLSGDERPEYCRQIQRPIIKSLRPRPGQRAVDLETKIRKIGVRSWAEGPGEWPERLILLDAHVEGIYGGTGTKGDWDLAQEIAERYPVLLSGGLSPDNVGDAVAQARPWGVDVSSGVETNGVKDVHKIRAFVRAAKRRDEIRP
ncbi:MAG: phosphoribosylanthranilate isomerase [Chloroflexi bacterium]|nr:phosphoribosylanthranilate isomerase [Chloroflexota bacterium]